MRVVRECWRTLRGTEILMLGKWRSIRLWLTFTLLIAAAALAHPQNERGPITVTHVQGSVYVIDGAIDEIGVSAGKDGILLVDGGYMETFPDVRKSTKSFGKGMPKFLINTHWHHAFANEAFGSSTVLISHSLARARLQHENTMYIYKVAAMPSIAWPVITFDETLTIHFNGEEISLIYIPYAHTDGDIVAIFHQSNVVMTGDVFVPSIPGIDTATGGTVAGLQAGIDKLLQIVPKDAKIIPGHGRVCAYSDLEAFRELVAESIQFVKSEIRAGRSLEEIKAAGVPQKWKSWEKGVPQEMFVEGIYKVLKEEGSGRTE
jgi:cyclase